MSTYVYFRIKEPQTNLIDYSRNTEVYQELYEAGMSSWDKWTDMDLHVVKSAIDQVGHYIKVTRERMAFEHSKEYADWKDDLDYLMDLVATERELSVIYRIGLETPIEWMVC